MSRASGDGSAGSSRVSQAAGPQPATCSAYGLAQTCGLQATSCMIMGMGTLHITEAELACDVHTVLAKVQEGMEVIVERNRRPVAVIRTPSLKGHLQSENIALAEAPSATARPDEGFMRDLEEGISGVSEQEWLRCHWREYAGKWVAIDGNRLIAEATGAREALQTARAAGVGSPFLLHVTEPSELPFGGW